MSYRELRNFTEIMRALGYPRLISMENFRKPNFELVADILYWMVKLYDPETTISDRVEFENERVEFLTQIATLMATKARLKLVTKKLYASDGKAVQELLKVATLLYKATKSTSKKIDDETVPPPIKVQDVKLARQLASDLTQSGAKLYDLLETEVVDRQERARALRFLDQTASTSDGPREQAYIERSIRDIIENTKQGLEDMRKECEECEADERNIEVKIKKKQEELERTEKRLKSLENVRPQFMEEAEKLEKELQRYYDLYMEKHRNLDYLEHELDKYRLHEEERKEEHDKKLKKMRERLLKEEVDIMRGGGNRPADEESGGGSYKHNSRDTNNGRGGSSDNKNKVQGSMNGGRGGNGRAPISDGESSEEGSGSEDDERDNRRGRQEYGSRSRQGDSEDEELSVNEHARGRDSGPRRDGGGGRGGGAPQGGRGSGGGRRDDDSDGFLDDDDDEEGDEEDDGDEGEFSGSDDF